MGVTSRLQLERIEEAARIIEPVFLNSPQFRVEPLEGLLGCRVELDNLSFMVNRDDTV